MHRWLEETPEEEPWALVEKSSDRSLSHKDVAERRNPQIAAGGEAGKPRLGWSRARDSFAESDLAEPISERLMRA